MENYQQTLNGIIARGIAMLSDGNRVSDVLKAERKSIGDLIAQSYGNEEVVMNFLVLALKHFDDGDLTLATLTLDKLAEVLRQYRKIAGEYMVW